jgi:hypothetical protein
MGMITIIIGDHYIINCITMVHRVGSLEVKLPTWTDGKAEVGRVREEKESEERRSRCT